MASEAKVESTVTSSDDKADSTVDEIMNAGNEVKDKDSSIKNEKTGEKEKDSDNEEVESEEEVGLLDRPVEVTGCRARKKVERLDVSFSVSKEKPEFLEGKGQKLGECPRIELQIQKIKVPDLKPLHKILFNRTGSANEIKKNIRKFSGFPFERDSTEFNRRKTSVEKLTASVLKKVCLILDIERGGSKEDIVNRIMSFLLNPEDSGKKVPSKKKVSKDKKRVSFKKGKPELMTKSAKRLSEEEKQESVEEEEEEEEEDDDDSEGRDNSMGGTDEEAEKLLSDVTDDEDVEEEEEPKKKSKISKAKPKVAESGKKADKKSKAGKRKQENDSDVSSDAEPPAKKSKMPSDDELSKLIKKILDKADLQEITMKKVIKQVSDAYPDFDLTHKKAFIKSTIKSVIS